MLPIDRALEGLGLGGSVQVLPVLSGYPSPKYINLVLRRDDRGTLLFESSVARPDVVAEVEKTLKTAGVRALDAVLVTHCHGDHAGGAGLVAAYGRERGERAPIHLHSRGFRQLSHPEASFLNETYELFLARSQWGLLEYNQLADEDMVGHAIRLRYAGYFSRTPKSAMRFVDHGHLPEGIVAVHTPGHSPDCCLYYDERLQFAVPGDTIITTGKPEEQGSAAYVVPIFWMGEVYSMAYLGFLRTIGVLRRFFETHEVRVIFPPHGRFAVTEPFAWCDFAAGYFEGIYRALLDDFLGDAKAGWRTRPFRACDLNPYIPSAGAHPISTPSHTFGMLCMLADEGYLSMSEHPHSRQITFGVEKMPPEGLVAVLLAQDPGPIEVFRGSQAAGRNMLPSRPRRSR